MNTLERLAKISAENWINHIQKYEEQMKFACRNVDTKVGGYGHFIFLSHCKLEAGMDASLMRGEIELLLKGNPSLPGAMLDDPCFLDSDDLQDLQQLQDHVRYCQNLVLLCTERIIYRPLCFVEIHTSKAADIRILPLTVDKPGNKFTFPTDTFLEAMERWDVLDEAGKQILRECGVSLTDVVVAIRFVFKHIAVTYSLHKSMAIREAELRALLRRCATGH